MKIKLVIINILVAILVVVGIEWALKTHHHALDGKSEYNWLINAGIHAPSLGNPQTNNFGFRSKYDYQPNKDNSTFRILVVGSSAVEGSISENWPDELMKILNENESERTFEVFNGGVSGSASSRELHLLSKWVHFNPDLVIVSNGWNDLVGSHYAEEAYKQYDKDSHERVFDIESQVKFFLARNSAIYQYIRKLKEGAKSNALDTTKATTNIIQNDDNNIPVLNKDNTLKIKYVYQGIENHYTINHSAPIEDGFSEIYRSNMELMAKLCKDNDIPFIAIPETNLLYYQSIYNPSLDISEVINLELHKNKDWQRTVQNLYPSLMNIAKDSSKKYGGHFFDLTEVFGKLKKPSLYFKDDVHMTSLGKEKYAQALYQTLKNNKFI